MVVLFIPDQSRFGFIAFCRWCLIINAQLHRTAGHAPEFRVAQEMTATNPPCHLICTFYLFLPACSLVFFSLHGPECISVLYYTRYRAAHCRMPHRTAAAVWSVLVRPRPAAAAAAGCITSICYDYHGCFYN